MLRVALTKTGRAHACAARVSRTPSSALRASIIFHSPRRALSTTTEDKKLIYTSPSERPITLLKRFCIGGTGLTLVLAPLLLLAEAELPLVARVAAAALAVGGTASTTAFVATFFRGHVLRARRVSGGGVELETATLTLRPRLTTVYDPAFLVPGTRPGAPMALAERVNGNGADGAEETVAQTADVQGRVLGRWVVRWDAGVGTCRGAGAVIREFQLHEELLTEPLVPKQ